MTRESVDVVTTVGDGRAGDVTELALSYLHRAERNAAGGSPTIAGLHATIGHGYALLAQSSQQHLLALIAQYQALCTLLAAGHSTDSLIMDMQRLELLIQKGLGL